MRVLVTGASGFLGGAIARALLARGDQVSGLQRSVAPELASLGVQMHQGDLADSAAVLRAVRGVDAVIHTAAKAGHWGSFESYHQANVVGTENVIAACLQQGISKLVYTSTPSVAHAGGDLAGVDESTPIPKHFDAHYPATKALGETAVLAANNHALATCALRPHLIWGPGDHHLLPRLLARARAGKLAFVGRQSKLIDTIYIDNAVHAHLLALDQLSSSAACAGKAYFVSNDEPIALDEICNRLIACADLPPSQRRIGYPFAWLAGLTLEFVYSMLPISGEPIMTRFLANQLATAHWYDIGAIKRDLGYQPLISIAQGLKQLRLALKSERFTTT